MIENRQQYKDKVLEILQQHKGPEHCITMQELHRQASGEVIIPYRRYDQTRITRSIIEQLRREGQPIAKRSGTNGGYFFAQNPEELEPTIKWFHSRALTSLRQEAALKRTSTKQLVKQYEIELAEEEF